MILVQGLDVFEMATEHLEIDSKIVEVTNLDNFYVTIESIYFIRDSKPFIFDRIENNFTNLLDNNISIISASSNTNYFWCLISNNSILELLQFSSDCLIEKTIINNFLNKSDLVLISTDINTYIFQNDQNGLICLFELKNKADLGKKILTQEQNLNENSLSTIELNKILIDKKVKCFSSGKEHILALTETNSEVYSFGIGTKGQLGFGKIENRFQFTKIFNKAKYLCNGNIGWHSGLIDENHDCFLWGWNSNCQIDPISSIVPNPTKKSIKDDLTGREIKFRKISLGSKHTVLIDTQHNLYSFGWNKYNQLFLENDGLNDLDEDNFNVESPVKIIEFNEKVLDVKCGPWSTILLFKD
ncbi:unnamed protein product [Brachionus calyciflorus]|uniref:Uncharacterized protein n=1 Tax=Brachionus calyciflorus TaxID=104777 RepID=A0A813SSR0_9BILA|nr:unnamed protein product [Brachionus calyciflorus]